MNVQCHSRVVIATAVVVIAVISYGSGTHPLGYRNGHAVAVIVIGQGRRERSRVTAASIGVVRRVTSTPSAVKF